MGTNYYARIIPTKKRREELKQLIDTDDFNHIVNEINKTYGRFETFGDNIKPYGEVHLGKSSGGWKFLWNPNIYLIRNGYSEKIDHGNGHVSYKYHELPDTAYYVYELTQQGIKKFIDRDDVEIYDEYNVKLDKDEFFKMAIEHNTGWDAASYENGHPNKSKYYLNNDYSRLLEKEGFVFTSPTHSDFYSDGMRFATSTDFC